jgi:hypothetical protein
VKPLYLQGRDGMRVSLDEPALRVMAPGRAATFYPLRRVSRVITSGPVEWSTAALLACAGRGITVTFLHGDGSLQAYLLGASDRHEALFVRLVNLLDRVDWRARYSDWYRAMESRARRALLRRLCLPPEAAPGAAALAGLLLARKQQYASPGVCQFLDRRLRGLLAALVAEELAATGLTAEQARSLQGRLPLADDLTGLLNWDLHLPVLEWLATGCKGRRLKIEPVELTALFEARVERLRYLAQTILNRLDNWLTELDL